MRKHIALWAIACTALATFAPVSQSDAATPTKATTRPHCASAAIQQADKLLKFHTGNDDRASVDASTIRKIGTVKSLLGNRQFDVLQVEGSVYKGSYRMRMIYAQLSDECVLVGQEIFERTGL